MVLKVNSKDFTLQDGKSIALRAAECTTRPEQSLANSTVIQGAGTDLNV
jgi:hypothetical protein